MPKANQDAGMPKSLAFTIRDNEYEICSAAMLSRDRVAIVDQRLAIAIGNTATGAIEKVLTKHRKNKVADYYIAKASDDSVFLLDKKAKDLIVVNVDSEEMTNKFRIPMKNTKTEDAFPSNREHIGIYASGAGSAYLVAYTKYNRKEVLDVYYIDERSNFAPRKLLTTDTAFDIDKEIIKCCGGKLAIIDDQGNCHFFDGEEEYRRKAMPFGKIEGFDFIDPQNLLFCGAKGEGYAIEKWNVSSNAMELVSSYQDMGGPAYVNGIKYLGGSKLARFYRGAVIIDMVDGKMKSSFVKILHEEAGKKVEGQVRGIGAVNGEYCAFVSDCGELCVYNYKNYKIAYRDLKAPMGRIGLVGNSILVHDRRNQKLLAFDLNLAKETIMAADVLDFEDSPYERSVAWSDRVVYVLG